MRHSDDSSTRLTSLDALRGLVIAVMALDHTRDFFHAAAMVGAPDDLAHTTAPIFLTRWITHLCAPTFFLTAGMAARLRASAAGHDHRRGARGSCGPAGCG